MFWSTKKKKEANAPAIPELAQLALNRITDAFEIIRGIEINLAALTRKVELLEQKSEIPAAYVEITEKIAAHLGTDAVVAWRVLEAYKNFQNPTTRVIEKLQKQKAEADTKKIHNCYKCGRPLDEGEYYKLGQKIGCLDKANCKPSEQAPPGYKITGLEKKKKEESTNENNQNLL